MSTKDLLAEAMKLKPEERFTLVEGLIKSLDEPDKKLGWVKRMTSANAQLLLQTSGGTTLGFVASTTADTWVNAVFSSYTSGANCKISLADSNTSGGEHRYDDISAKPFTASQLFATVPTSIASVTAQVTLTVTPGNKHGGLVINMDSPTNPQNYVAAYLTAGEEGGMNAYITKCVSGTISRVLKGSVTYGATKYLKLVKNGNSYSLYYGRPMCR